MENQPPNILAEISDADERREKLEKSKDRLSDLNEIISRLGMKPKAVKSSMPR